MTIAEIGRFVEAQIRGMEKEKAAKLVPTDASEIDQTWKKGYVAGLDDGIEVLKSILHEITEP